MFLKTNNFNEIYVQIKSIKKMENQCKNNENSGKNIYRIRKKFKIFLVQINYTIIFCKK